MRRMFLSIFVITLALFAFGSSTLAQKDKDKDKNKMNDHGGQPLEAMLRGAAEVPGPGDADGGGAVKITLNHGKNEVCYELSVKNIQTATMAHIHAGAAGQTGDVKVTFDPPASGKSKSCVSADQNLIMDIMQNPANYYVNVHNAEFPNGAVRGQLGKK